MKKIIIVNNNMKVGGVQKSLLNLLWELGDGYDVTLYLFCSLGSYTDQLPPWVQVKECKSLFRYLGISQGECRGIQKLTRGLLALLCKLLGRDLVLKLMLLSQKPLPETYDCAISFLHNGGAKSFYGGVQEFVLSKINSRKKAAFLHCDYSGCGGNYPENNRKLASFDTIAACSDGCRRAFLEVLPALEDKCVTVRNCHRFMQIRQLAQEEPVTYESGKIHVVMINRLSHEKGIDRAILALKKALDAGVPAMLHILGGGGMEAQLRELVNSNRLEDSVRFYGEQTNPYRYLKNADLLLMTSYHEAAPLVIEEARHLGVPVMTTATTSSQEMVTDAGAGWVCENSQTGIDRCLLEILRDPQSLKDKKTELTSCLPDNTQALGQFQHMIGL